MKSKASDWARYDETVDGNVLDGSSPNGADDWSIDDGAPTIFHTFFAKIHQNFHTP